MQQPFGAAVYLFVKHSLTDIERTPVGSIALGGYDIHYRLRLSKRKLAVYKSSLCKFSPGSRHGSAVVYGS